MNAWTYLKPQIIEFISDLHFNGWRNEDIAAKLSNRLYWIEEEPFRREVFNYESARFTLHQLCNIVDMLSGSDEAFVDALRGHILALVQPEYEREVAAIEGQQKLVYELETAIERKWSA